MGGSFLDRPLTSMEASMWLTGLLKRSDGRRLTSCLGAPRQGYLKKPGRSSVDIRPEFSQLLQFTVETFRLDLYDVW